MLKAKQRCEGKGQTFTVFVADLQLHKIAVEVSWHYPRLLDIRFVIRLGGMHLLINFIGSVGKLMKNTGLKKFFNLVLEVWKKCFLGNFPPKPKSSPANCWGTHSWHTQKCSDYEDLDEILQSLSVQSLTLKICINLLIRPLLLCLLYVRAEKEGNFILHLYCVQEMLPYFFAAVHHYYARWAWYYLQSMPRLPNDALFVFSSRAAYVVRRKKG